MTELTCRDLTTHLGTLSAWALGDLGVDGVDAPSLAPPPDPEMGDLGFPCFPYSKALRRSPQQIAQELQAKLAERVSEDPVASGVRATGPYLNFTVDQAKVLALALREMRARPGGFGAGRAGGRVMVEYSSPNTNKPQHLGHVRNNLLGETVSNILAHAGSDVIRANLINDRGIHICKSMLAYQRFGDGVTPEDRGVKGDHLIGDFYVAFDRAFRDEYVQWLATPEADTAFAQWRVSRAARKPVQAWAKARKKAGESQEPTDAVLRGLFEANYKDVYFNTASELGAAARDLLVRWEADDAEVRALWRRLNGWVEAGFEQTYARLGIHFDRIDHESETYTLGKDLVDVGLASGVFHRADNGAAVFDLTRIGLSGEKAVMRADGTSLYTTQDLGTAVSRFDECQIDQLIYVVGDEQNHHFKVLFGILGLLRPETAGRCHHLSYGMINLPSGKMKSREGTVVDADDLMDEMHSLAANAVRERWPELDADEIESRAEAIGIGALKYYLMAFSPQTTMTFDPQESLAFTGKTGVYAIYSYARTASILRNVGEVPTDTSTLGALSSELEFGIIRELAGFAGVVDHAAADRDPSRITEWIWRLSKALAAFFSDKDHNVMHTEDPALRAARIQLMWAVNQALHTGLGLLGITPLEQA